MKMVTGIETACYKRPVSPDQIESIVAQIEAEIYENFDREVPSRFIGERVSTVLKDVDQVAFVRFASVYRNFTDANDFVTEIQPMLRTDD